MSGTGIPDADRRTDPARLAAVGRVQVHDPRIQRAMNRWAGLLSRLLHAPVAQVNLVTATQQHPIGSAGGEEWTVPTGLERSFCQHVVALVEPMIVSDARTHPLLAHNLATTEGGIVAYASAPLTLSSGATIGTLCVVDFQSREWRQEEVEILLDLADAVVAELERGVAEAALRESEARFRAVQEISPDGFQLCESVRDRAGRVVDFVYRYLNPAGLRLIGRTECEMLGRRMLDVFPGLVNDDLFTTYVRVAETGEPAQREVVYTRDGLDGGFRVTVVRIGEGVAISFSDVTGRLRAEAALRESEARFRTTFERAALGMGRVGFQAGRWLEVNDAFCSMLGYTRDELLAVSWPEITHPDDLHLDLAPFQRMAAGELETYSVEKRFIHRDGHHVWARLTLSLVRDAAGRPDYEIAVIEDITRRHQNEVERERLLAAERAARAEAEEANRAKMEFLSAMSHELRTPLNAIAGYVDLLDMGIHGPVTDAQREALRRTQRAQQHLLRLINDVLHFVRLEAGQVQYEFGPVLAADALRDILPLIEPQIAARGHTLVVDLPEHRGEPPVPLLADREKLAQVLLNVLGNAVKFTPPGGSIRVEVTATEDGRAELRVADNGLGIPADKQQSIFDPFVQVDRSLTRAHEGTGLGLAISRDLAQGMGGALTVESALGHGSTFTLSLPIAHPSDR